MGRGIITIDGPAGAGKSTVARLLAQNLGYLYLDSGALYRTAAWQARRQGLDLTDPAALAALLADFHPQVAYDSQGFHLFLDGREVSEELRTADMGRCASQVAIHPVVRNWVNFQLRRLAQDGGVVTEGRDQGTAVFPEASNKFYLDAGLAARAQRRRQDWQRDCGPPPLTEIMAALAARDEQDANRSEAPLRRPADAVVIDTTELSVEQVVEKCLLVISNQ